MRDAIAWEDLRFVLALARAGNLRRAAGTLGVDATTVGRRLAAIDERVGYPLFERTGAAWTVTSAARALLADLEAMEASALAAERKLAGGATAATGVVRVAASDAFTIHRLLGDLRRLGDELPGIEIELVTSSGLADLRRREADIAVRFVKPDSQELRARRISSLRWSLYGSADYLARAPRVDPQSGLAGHRILRWSGPPLRPAVIAWLDEHSTAATTALRSRDLHVLIEACSNGMGLAALPGAMARNRGLVRTIDHHIDASDVWLIVHRDLRKVPRVRAVADWLWARLRADADRLHAI
jgi:DNA-binding transcriptional LysR family regulator